MAQLVRFQEQDILQEAVALIALQVLLEWLLFQEEKVEGVMVIQEQVLEEQILAVVVEHQDLNPHQTVVQE
jgi:predicted transcriptional regulator